MDRSYYYPPNSAELDPNAVDELFENVIYGEGIDADDGAQQRREESERRRSEVEQRAQENALKRAQADQDRQFFNNLILSGPDRPVTKMDTSSAPKSAVSSKSMKFQIPFTAADRSRIPRKTRQQWLDKFILACDAAFPNSLVTLDQSLILSFEQCVFQTARTPTAYIGAWMNNIHGMKSASSLSEFISPTTKTDSKLVANNHQDGDKVPDAAVSALKSTSLADSGIDPSRRSDQKNDIVEHSTSSATLSVNPGTALLFGKQLRFNLFGSDDEDESNLSPPVITDTQNAPDQSDLVAAQGEPSDTIKERELSQDAESVQPEKLPLGRTAATSPEVPDSSVLKTADADSLSESVSVPSLPIFRGDVAETSVPCENPLSSEHVCKEENILVRMPIDDHVQVLPSEVRKPAPHSSVKRRPDGTSDGSPALKKRKKQFDPECEHFIRDVVAAHLRLRYGSKLSGKIVISVQSRAVEKILSGPSWTLERLRKHKRHIDDLAERYANKIRHEK